MFQFISDYAPLVPYEPKGRKALEVQMFSKNYLSLHRLYLKIQEEASHPEALDNNEFFLHLDWLLKRGEDRVCKVICPHCKKVPVECFTYGKVFGGDKAYFKKSDSFLFCSSCAATIKDKTFYPFKFSVLLKMHTKYQHNYLKEVLPVFKYAFGMEGRLAKEKAFAFFAAITKKQIMTIANIESTETEDVKWHKPVKNSQSKTSRKEKMLENNFELFEKE